MDMILKVIGFVMFWLVGAWIMAYLKDSYYNKPNKKSKDQYFKDEEKKRDNYFK